MAKKKATGATRQHTTRPGKRRGLKIGGGEQVKVGQILVRQQGTKYFPGEGVGMGRDHTLFALKEGKVNFKTKLGRKYLIIAGQ